MDDPLFALLDDIAQTAKDGGQRHGMSNSFNNHQLPDNKPQYYPQQHPAQNVRGDDKFENKSRGESRCTREGEYGQPQGQCMTPLRSCHDNDRIEKRADTFKTTAVKSLLVWPASPSHHIVLDKPILTCVRLNSSNFEQITSV